MVKRFLQQPRLKGLLAILCILAGTQLNAATFTASMTATPTHKSCYAGTYSVSYVATVPPPSGYTYPADYHFDMNQTKFELRKTSTGSGGTILATNTGGTVGSSGGSGTISGTFNISGLSDGLFSATSPREDVYTIYATIFLEDGPIETTIIVTTNVSFTIGYKTLWSNMLDMSSAGTTTTTRSIVTSGITYGGAKASNYIPASTSSYNWIDIGAQFSGVTTTRSSYVMLTDFAVSSSFTPSGVTAYLEFRKGGTITSTSGEGIYFKSGTSVYKLAGVVLSDRIRIQRSLGEIKFYKTNSTTALSWTYVSGTTISSIPSTAEVFITAYATLTSDGFDAITSAKCAEGNTGFAKLERNLTGVNYTATDKLYFSYDEEYLPTGTNLTYRILNLQHKTVQASPSVSGATLVNITRTYGDNRFELPLASSVVVGSAYILEATNDKGEVFYLRFTRK